MAAPARGLARAGARPSSAYRFVCICEDEAFSVHSQFQIYLTGNIIPIISSVANYFSAGLQFTNHASVQNDRKSGEA